jgi:hypothetical protein
MFLEGEYLVLDKPQLPVGHPLHYLEDVVKKETPLKKKDYHDAEHEDILIHLGIDVKQTAKLTIREINGQFAADRLYHIMIHLWWWKLKKEKFPERQQYVERFEAETGFNLDNLTLPTPASKVVGEY